MMHPVGTLPPAVYWRRRLMFVVLPAFLVVLVVAYLFSGDGGSAKQPVGLAAASPTSPSPRGPAPGPSTAKSTPATPTRPGTSAVVIRTCAAADLLIQAASGKPVYPVKANPGPDLYLMVTNISSSPCRTDLGDPKIELLIHIGGARVWSSHDCKIEPGVSLTTLKVKSPVRRGIIWSGLTSAPSCPNNRIVAQAGTYTLTASLAGQLSAPVTFRLGD